ncbi:hypothetical protein [Rhizobium miluonense]|jgi:hypothetical protein|uniref:Uncharacterized protein n=1 Tax=Rhizobium miluonense TaxID=411945 RepID=A0ABU1T0C1_9HYPH|nr:hypothetical protein [Rhizobium miluonense]
MNIALANHFISTELGRPLRVGEQFLLRCEVAKQLFQPGFLLLANPVASDEILDAPDLAQLALFNLLYLQ